MSKRFVGTLILVFWCFGFGTWVGYRAGRMHTTFTQDHREHKELEGHLTDMESRVATLERIGVEIYMFGDTPYRVKGVE